MSTKFDSTYSAVVSMAEQLVGEGKYDSTYSAVLAIYQNLTSDVDTKFDSVYSIVVKIADGIESGDIDLGGGGSDEIEWNPTPKYLPQLIRFINGLGEIVDVWDFDDRLNKTELPELSDITLPDGTILYGNKWNFTLEEIKQSEIPVDVGVLYDSIDGNSYINIEITPENLNTVLFIELYGDTTIEWGDGTSDNIDTINGYPQHTYNQRGNYLIKISGGWLAKYSQSNMGVTSYFNYPNFYYYNQIKYIYIASGDYSNSNQWDFQYLYNCEYLIFGETYFNNPYFYIYNTGLQHSLNIPSNNNNVRIYILESSLSYITLPVSNSYYQEIVVENTNVNNLSLNRNFLNGCEVAFRNRNYEPVTLNIINFPNYITKTSSSSMDINNLNSPVMYSVIDDKLYVQGADYLDNRTSFYRNGEKVDWDKIVREIEQESYSSITQGAFYWRTFDSIKLCDRLISVPQYCFQYSNINDIYLNEGLSGINSGAFYSTAATVHMPDNVIPNFKYDAFYYCADIILKWNSIESLKNNYKHYIVNSGKNLSLLSRSVINDKQIRRFEILDDSYVDVQYIAFGGDLFLGKQLQTIGGYGPFISGDIYYQGTLNEWLDISLQSTYTPYNTKLYVNSIINDDGSFSGDLIEGDLTLTKDIKKYSFYHNDYIKNIIISDGVTSIGEGAFHSCSIETIYIPDSVTSIGSNAFISCLGLKEISLTNIDNAMGLITGCHNLQSIKLTYNEDGHKLEQLRYYGYNPKNFILDMSDCTVIPTLSSTGYSSVSNSNGYYLILVPESLYDEWIASTNWSSLSSQIKPVPGK